MDKREICRSFAEISAAAAPVPGTDYGTVEHREYYSVFAEKNKSVSILLPPGYDRNERYPVLYILHGFFGDEYSMLGEGMPVRTLIGNLIYGAEAEKMITVFPAMFTSRTKEGCDGYTAENAGAYDNFLFDMTDSLMPFIAENYPVRTDRGGTAMTGFSMGGRESLNISISRPELFGYVGAVCPAPGLTPAQDKLMIHPGCMREEELHFAEKPELLMISAAQSDETVGYNPQNYHDILIRNGEEHIWQLISDGDHGAKSVSAHIYEFARRIFK